MKKAILFSILLFAVVAVSCGGGASTGSSDSTTVAVDTAAVVADSANVVAADSTK